VKIRVRTVDSTSNAIVLLCWSGCVALSSSGVNSGWLVACSVSLYSCDFEVSTNLEVGAFAVDFGVVGEDILDCCTNSLGNRVAGITRFDCDGLSTG